MKPKTLLAVLCFNLLPTLAGAADWMQFRGPGGLGISQEKELPTSWDGTKNLYWKRKLPGPGGSSPITVGNRVFVTCYSGYGTDKEGEQADLRRHVFCLDRRSGQVKWTKEFQPVLPETAYTGFITHHGYAASTPISDGERLYVFLGKTGVFAFDLDGKQLWKVSVGEGTHGWGSAASPILYKDMLIVNAGVECGAVVALNKADGKQVWKYPGIQRSWATPVLVNVKDGKTEVVLNIPNKVISLDPDTGKELWSCDGIHDYICPSVTAKDGIVYAIGGRSATAVAIRAGGKGDVTESHRLWKKNLGANVTSPVVVGDHLYWVSDAGTAYCLKAATGEKEYGERVDGANRVYASAVAADGKFYVVSRERGTFVLAAKPKYELLGRNVFADDKGIFNGSPAVSDGQVFIRSNQYIYCVGKK